MKNRKLNQWLWKWHVIAGLISAPCIALLAITGGLYLFKDAYEKPTIANIETVAPITESFSFDEQRRTADSVREEPHTSMVLPADAAKATQFIAGRFGDKISTYIDPYTNKATGVFNETTSGMYKVRKLHGALLLGKAGAYIIELVASWMVVLLVTGIFVWWPASRWRFSGFFIPRFGMGKKVLFRDLHAITAFWISGLLLLVLAGAFPWTEIVGANFKTVQKLTQTGFPETWMGIGLSKPTTGREIPLDSIVSKARKLNLPGKVHIDFPYGSAGVYSVGNIYYPDLSLQQKFHYNPYTGNLVLHQKWEDVGILMRGRMWVMAFHQGQFGPWNWWLMLIVAFFLFLSSLAAIVSYFAKKPKNRWVIPHVPRGFQASFGVIVIIIFLGLMFPLFGLSAFLIFVYEKTKLGRAIAEKQ